MTDTQESHEQYMSRMGKQISITDIKEHEDGSATYTVDMDASSTTTLAGFGLKLAMYCAAFDITIEEGLAIISAAKSKV